MPDRSRHVPSRSSFPERAERWTIKPGVHQRIVCDGPEPTEPLEVVSASRLDTAEKDRAALKIENAGLREALAELKTGKLAPEGWEGEPREVGCGTPIGERGRETRCGVGGLCVKCWQIKNDRDPDTLLRERDQARSDLDHLRQGLKGLRDTLIGAAKLADPEREGEALLDVAVRLNTLLASPPDTEDDPVPERCTRCGGTRDAPQLIDARERPPFVSNWHSTPMPCPDPWHLRVPERGEG